MLIRHSVFKSDPLGDGGARRTAQISELLANMSETAPFLQLTNSPGRLISLVSLGAIIFLRRTGFPLRLCAETLRCVAPDLHAFQKQFAALPAGSLLIWEGTQSRFAYLSMLAREAGIRVIGLPHNLESLVPGTCSFLTGRLAPLWLEEEIQSLAACDAVFAISREDQWLLRLHGISAGYLPYYPPKDVNESLRKIRLTRKKPALRGDLLLLGTAGNKPTYSGMADRLRFFSKHRDLFSRLHVAGYGTDRLKQMTDGSDGIYFHGTIDNNSLDKLLADVRAAVVHQPPTSGSLTRVPELLLAGVPVLANTDASRSYFGLSGVYTYENDAQLIDLLAGKLATFEAPEKPVALEQMLLEQIASLVG